MAALSKGAIRHQGKVGGRTLYSQMQACVTFFLVHIYKRCLYKEVIVLENNLLGRGGGAKRRQNNRGGGEATFSSAFVAKHSNPLPRTSTLLNRFMVLYASYLLGILLR